jgi:hypothetical protein
MDREPYQLDRNLYKIKLHSHVGIKYYVFSDVNELFHGVVCMLMHYIYLCISSYRREAYWPGESILSSCNVRNSHRNLLCMRVLALYLVQYSLLVVPRNELVGF